MCCRSLCHLPALADTPHRHDLLEVPTEVIDYVAEQLRIADPSFVKRYTERRTTRFEHADEIKRACGLRDFAAAEGELTAWVDARA